MGKIDLNPSKGFKKGYAINNKVMTDNQLNKKFQKTNKNHQGKYYPNGMIPFVCLLVFYVITLITCVTVLSQMDEVLFRYHWHTTVISVAFSYLLMNILWAIGRSGFSSGVGYGLMKFGRFVRWSELRTKIEYHGNDPAIAEVNSAKEFNAYCMERKKHTIKWFIISISTSGTITIISLCIWLGYEYGVIR